MLKTVAHVVVELAGMASIVAAAWLYDFRIGLLVIGLACLHATTRGGLRLPKKG